MTDQNDQNQPSVPTTGVTDDDLLCDCCDPGQPLEPVDGEAGMYMCPVNGTRYSYDPAMGGKPRRAAQEQEVATEAPFNTTNEDDDDFFEQAPRRDNARQVDPSEPFA